MGNRQAAIGERAAKEPSIMERVEFLFQMIEFAQEIGRPNNAVHYVKRIEEILDGTVDAATQERLSRAKDWAAWAVEYEKINGLESLLNRTHPIHLSALAKAERLRETENLSDHRIDHGDRPEVCARH